MTVDETQTRKQAKKHKLGSIKQEKKRHYTNSNQHASHVSP